MPRSPRQDYEGAWQHAMNRGIDRQAVFRSDDARQIFYDRRVPEWLRTDVILDMFGPQGAREKYREFLGEETDADVSASYAEWQGVPWGQTRRV